MKPINNQNTKIHDISIQSIRAIAEETNEIGDNVLNTIEKQDEQLDSTNNNIKRTEELHTMSSWILRNMTWSGWFYNLFTRLPVIKQRETNELNKINESSKQNVFINKNKMINIDNIDNKNKDQKENKYIAYNSILFNSELTEIEKTLKNIHNTGIKIGEKLDEQNKKLNETSSKSDIMNEKIHRSNSKIIKWL